jgi:hypothetical protein
VEALNLIVLELLIEGIVAQTRTVRGRQHEALHDEKHRDAREKDE